MGPHLSIGNGYPRLDRELAALLRAYPSLAIQPSADESTIVTGTLSFEAIYEQVCLADSYSIALHVPSDYPTNAPVAHEAGGRIPLTYHHMADGSLCVGSPIRIDLWIRRSPTLLAFVDEFVVPYLYGYSYLQKFGKPPPFGDLRHGDDGVIDDLRALLNAPSNACAVVLMGLAAMQRRKANARLCPCQSGKRLSRCHGRAVRQLRAGLGRVLCRHYFRRFHENRIAEKRIDSMRQRLRLAPLHRRIDAAIGANMPQQ